MTSANLVGWCVWRRDEEQDKGGVTFQRTSVACVRPCASVCRRGGIDVNCDILGMFQYLDTEIFYHSFIIEQGTEVGY